MKNLPAAWDFSLTFGVPVLVLGLAMLITAFVLAAPAGLRPATADSTWFDTLSLSEQRDSIVATEARRANVPAALAIAVSHTENWTGDSAAISKVGAVGLMQVMPRYWLHSFEEECGCGDLTNRRRNACKGVRVLRFYLDSSRTVDAALRAYHGSNKPHLHAAGDAYVGGVLQRLTLVAR